MAQVEPMDIDAIESGFDNKENAFHHNNVLSRTPCTEKGYEELDVSELNMKLRYSVTPASSPMSKSFTGSCLDTRNCYSEDRVNNAAGNENGNLTRSLNSTLTKTEGFSKSKILPLQALSADPFVDNNRNSSIRRLVDPTNNDVMISENNSYDLDDNLSLPSTCSSVPDTPEVTTPTKEVPKPEGSPIMRGLKSVLSMFRPSQSPISPSDKSSKPIMHSPVDFNNSEAHIVQASTPMSANTQTETGSSKRSSPLKESLTFNDDLERQLQWKEETTIIFKEERIPVQKLFFQNPIMEISTVPKSVNEVEHMDISCNESITSNENIIDQSVKKEYPVAAESDNEFLDCETTFTKTETNYDNLDIDNEVMMTGNVTVDLSNNAGITKQMKLECNNIVDNTICTTSGNVAMCSDPTTVIITDVAPQIGRNNMDIVEATINLLKSESIDYSKVVVDHSAKKSLNSFMISEPQICKELQLKDSNITEFVDKDIINHANLINTSEAKQFPTLNVMSKNLENKQNEESEIHVCSNIDIQLGVCAENVYNICNPEESSSETSHTVEKFETVDNLTEPVQNVNNLKDKYASENNGINKEETDVIYNIPNIEQQNVIDNSSNLQSSELQSATDALSSHKDIAVVTVGDIQFDAKNLNHSINTPNEVEGVLDEKYKPIQDIPVLTMPIQISLPLVDNNNSANSLFVMSDINDELNASSARSILRLPKKIDIDESNNGKNESNLLMNAASSSCLVNLESNADSKINDKISYNYPHVSELTVKNDMSSISPSEIPLPDEDDIKLNILGSRNMNKEVCKQQDITTIEILERNPIMDLPNRLIVEDVTNDDGSIQVNPIEVNEQVTMINVINNNSVEITDNIPIEDKGTSSQTCIEQSSLMHMTEDKSIDICIENMQEKIISDPQSQNVLASEENISKNTSLHEEIYTNANQDSLQMGVDKNCCITSIEKVENKDTGEVPDATEDKTAIIERNKLNMVNFGDKNSLYQFRETNRVKTIADKEQDFTQVKVEGEFDEEILTSANNSPYVSVTDLDTGIKKENQDPLEETEVMLQLEQYIETEKIASSPPLSPKIVSKGYNINFDDIDDPFATKTKIRMSPTPNTSNESLVTISKGIETQQEELSKKVTKKNYPIKKKIIKSSLCDQLGTNESTSEKHFDSEKRILKDNVSDDKEISLSLVRELIPDSKMLNADVVPQNNINYKKFNETTGNSVTSSAVQEMTIVVKEETESNNEKTKCLEQTLVISSEKSTSSSEQYFSLGPSSGESSGLMNRSKNVFNLPEIDDANFNPSCIKSKIGVASSCSEKPTNELEDIDVPQSLLQHQCQEPADNTNITSINAMDLKLNNKIANSSSPNTSNTTFSSKNANDIDYTVREILTEDEDTIEGPFLEADELESEKISEMDVENQIMNFDATQEKDENIENDELFIDADAFEFLLNQNKSTTVLDSGKESLFLKFDPLFAKKVSSDGILAALSKVQKRQSTPKKITTPLQKEFSLVEQSGANTPNDNENCSPIEDYQEDLASNMSKPMMVVNPAVSSIIGQKKSPTPKLNRRSLTFTSPAMAVIDRLLSLSGNTSQFDHDVSISQMGREHSETDVVITQLRELLAEKEINVHSLRSESKELKERLAKLENQVKDLESESSKRLTKIKELNERLLEKSKMNKSMAIVVEEYERTIASLIAESEQDRKRNAEERMKLIKERDEQTAHLTSMEVSFSDLHSKYEKSKQIILSCKANEDIYKKSIKEFQENFSKMQNNYELLKQHATSKLNHANQELEKMNRAHEAEVLKMNAMIKRKELHITSLEETLAQKTKANEELTAICDELINKVA